MDTNTISPVLQALLTAVLTLGAAFLGAGFAFRLENNARARQTVRDQVAAVNRAMFVLVRQFNSLKMIQQQVIDPSREAPNRSIGMRPSLRVDHGSPTLDLDSLSFLLETDARELVMRLLLEQERFEIALQSINERSRLHVEVLQPRMAEAGIREGVDYQANDIVKILGEPLILQMQRATDNAIQQVDETVKSNLEFADEFNRAMKKLFPKESIIGLAER